MLSVRTGELAANEREDPGNWTGRTQAQTGDSNDTRNTDTTGTQRTVRNAREHCPPTGGRPGPNPSLDTHDPPPRRNHEQQEVRADQRPVRRLSQRQESPGPDASAGILPNAHRRPNSDRSESSNISAAGNTPHSSDKARAPLPPKPDEEAERKRGYRPVSPMPTGKTLDSVSKHH